MRKGVALCTAGSLALVLFSGCGRGCNGCGESAEAYSRYEITVEYVPESGTLTGTEKITFENKTDNALSTLKFQLYPNAYRKDALYRPVDTALFGDAYYAGDSYGEMVVSSVNGAKSWEVMGEDENILYVHLEKPLYPEDTIVLDIAFMARLAKVNHRTGITERSVNLGNFFPLLCGIKEDTFYETVYYAQGDPFYSDCADFTVTVKVPKEYEVAASGETTAKRVLESKKEYTMSLTNARDFALVLSDRFSVLEGEVGDTKVYYYCYDKTDADAYLALACTALAYYEDTFGEYPYPVYTVVQTGFCMGGMEYPALTLLSDTLTWEEGVRVLAHETAHQWWYAVVGSDQIENAWQDEGLSEYSAITFLEGRDEYGVLREQAVTDALREYRAYYDVYGSVLGRTDTAMKRHLRDYISGYEYKCLAYDKSVVMFDTLRKSVGDKAFFEGLKKYYKENRFRIVGEGALVSAFERAGVDAQGYFDSFLLGKAIL